MKPELDETLPAPGGDDPSRTATLHATGQAAREPRAPGLTTGQQLGHFRIERRLGAGGMGEVYLATDLALDRPVAIKVLPEELARDPVRRDRMVREARAQARISHPNIGHIYFIGEEAGRLYFAMEYVAGETLAERSARGPLAVDDALAVIRGAALGLREAQRSGFTHRDVKPSNLMLDGHGVLKVLDFGLASPARGDVDGASGDGRAAASEQTSLAGTPLYMAPEQARGEAVDFRSDIYALGVTLYQLVSGKPPFESDSVAELITMHSSAARPALPRRGQSRAQIGALDALCGRMMAARPDDRFASYDELLRAIELASLAHTRPAGLWARSIATTLDVMAIALLFSLGEAVVEWLTDREAASLMPFMLPAIAVYAMVCTARWGSTAGKAIFELEVVDVETTRRPTLARAARRSLAMYGPAVVLAWATASCEATGLATATWILRVAFLVAIGAGVLALLYAALRVPGKRAPWDKLSSTMVRYRTTRHATAL